MVYYELRLSVSTMHGNVRSRSYCSSGHIGRWNRLVGYLVGCAMAFSPGCRERREQGIDVPVSMPAMTTEMATHSGGVPKMTVQSRGDESAVLISVDTLASMLKTGKRIVLDARAPDVYTQGHISDARSLPYTATYDSRAGREKNVAPVHEINRLLSDAGIDFDTPIVIYGSSDYRSAARLFWVLEVHGHPSVAVLDGGIEAWERAGYPVTKELPKWSKTDYVSVFDPDLHADKLEVFHALRDSNIEVVDSRSKVEYIGDKSMSDRYGHITTALHFDATDGLNRNDGVCTVQEVEHLARRFATIDRNKTVYTYCNTGQRASVNYLLLRSLGYRVAVYDGSWMEWSADANVPISRGNDPGRLND